MRCDFVEGRQSALRGLSCATRPATYIDVDFDNRIRDSRGGLTLEAPGRPHRASRKTRTLRANVASLGGPLFRFDLGVAAGRIRRGYHRHTMRADVGRRLSYTGIDIDGRVDDAARAGQLVAQGFARAAAYPFVRLHWHCRLRLGAPGVWLVIPTYGRRWVLERALVWAKAITGPPKRTAAITAVCRKEALSLRIGSLPRCRERTCSICQQGGDRAGSCFSIAGRLPAA